VTLRMDACATCGRVVFPPRALCPACGGAGWTPVESERGTVEQVTNRDGVEIVSVRSDLGPIVVARCDGGAESGCAVSLDREGAVPTATLVGGGP
jgi:Rubredoxin-like zinc ribbon domain (DUF35_N)